VETVFAMGVVGGIVLLPFVLAEVGILFTAAGFSVLLVLTGIIRFVNTVALFRAYDKGKLATVEPIMGLELPIAIGLAVLFLGEQITALQMAAICAVFVGVLLTVTKQWHYLHFHRRIFERGLLLALFAACTGALLNLSIGASSQSIPPLVVIWFVFVFGSLLSLPYLMRGHRYRQLMQKFRAHAPLVVVACLVDCGAWLAYAYATAGIQISLVVALSEGYIALAALLGVIFNHERLRAHQYAGVAVTAVAVVWLAQLTH
jgi:drug/metabolite transporter (DMT)-like permease